MRAVAGADSERAAVERRERLKEVLVQARGCVRCPELAATRKTVVFGAGNADAELMFVGEAPGASEDEQGVPFVGRAGKLLERLLEEIGLSRSEVFIANTLKCLRHDALVQLGDGSWERVGRLVRARYSGEVMSVDDAGALVPRRVIGWHASPLGGRRVFRLTHRSAEKAGAGRVSVRLTGDHPVLSERGYVSVQELRPDDRIATGQGMSSLAHDVLCGVLLGDGDLPLGCSSLSFSHSERESEYARFKADLLGELGTEIAERELATVAGGDRRHPVLHVRTLADRALRAVGRDFYRPQKVVPPWIAEKLNARMLAIWFMDDGYTRTRGRGRRPLAEIATACFTDGDLQVLMAGLARLGLRATTSRERLYFTVEATQQLSETIAPYVPPSMRHKLDPDVARRIPFDPARLNPGPTVARYDEVETEDVTDHERVDVTFFCLDVEGTHNFVTAGGVVHNCRPPGNRDPLPVEIQNCQEYLLRQVELIQPAVICTLGNFSTKLLRGDPTGITRLHGQPEVLVLGARAVRLYPIYHPAAALYTPRMLETLREDFARLPALLAMGAPEQPPAMGAPEQRPDQELEEAPEPELPEARTASPQAPPASVREAAEADQLGLF